MYGAKRGGGNLLWAGKPSLSSLEKKTPSSAWVCVPAGCSANDVSVVYDGAYSRARFLRPRTMAVGGESGDISSRRSLFALNQRAEKQKVNHGGSLGGASDHPDPSAGLLAASTSGGFVGVNARWSVMGRMKAPPPDPRKHLRAGVRLSQSARPQLRSTLNGGRFGQLPSESFFLRLLHFPHVVDWPFFPRVNARGFWFYSHLA